jgi:hypothetical protein
MNWLPWLEENWLHLLEATGIVSGLWFSVLTTRWDEKATRVSNLLTLTREHRELWMEYYRRPDLGRVLDAKADLLRSPVTLDETVFVKLLIQHLHSTYQAMRNGVFIEVEGLRTDVREFFKLPIPKSLWPSLRPFQNKDFVAFVERG